MRSLAALLAVLTLVLAAPSVDAASAGLRGNAHLRPPRTHSGPSNENIDRRVARIQLRLARMNPLQSSVHRRAYGDRRMERLVIPRD